MTTSKVFPCYQRLFSLSKIQPMDIGADIEDGYLNVKGILLPDNIQDSDYKIDMPYLWTDYSLPLEKASIKNKERMLALITKDLYINMIMLINNSFILCMRGTSGQIIDLTGNNQGIVKSKGMDKWEELSRRIAYIGFEKTVVLSSRMPTLRAKLPMDPVTSQVLINGKWVEAPYDAEVTLSESVFQEMVLGNYDNVVCSESGNQFNYEGRC